MSRIPGSTKTGGRKKGTPNRRTSELTEALTVNGIDIIAELADTLPHLLPNEKAGVLIDLMGFIYPKRKAVEVSNDEASTGPGTVIILPSKDEAEA